MGNAEPASEDSPALVAPKATRKPTREEACSGTVRALGPDWFELADGWKGRGEAILKKKPKHLSTWGTVVGGDPDGDRPMLGHHTHMATDLKVGDRVFIWYHGDKQGEWCINIEIVRRPGGKIPPMPVDRLGLQSDIPAQNQAYQDWEEKGTPIPEKYLTEGRVEETDPPYPPVAPQPREVKQ